MTPVTPDAFIAAIDVTAIDNAVMAVVSLSVGVAVIIAAAVLIKKLLKMV